MAALSHVRICDFTGQLAGAGGTRFLAAFGAEVIRIEDPVKQGKWDILRGVEPFKPGQRGLNNGGAFNNHNIEKRGITLNLRTDRGKELLAELVRISDVVTENFAAGVLASWGFDYEHLRSLKSDIIYVSNCGFGHRGPYRHYKTWGPIVQAMCGLTFTSGLPDQPPAGWGFSYMDHHGGNFMAVGILAALVHHSRTGEGQWVDMACTDAGATFVGPAMLDYTANGRGVRRPGSPSSNRNQSPPMAPHGIYPSLGEDEWIAISCRNDAEWSVLADVIGQTWAADSRWDTLDSRIEAEDDLDAAIAAWTRAFSKHDLAGRLRGRGVPAEPVQRPQERIDRDPRTETIGLWPTVQHDAIGDVRVDGLPARLSADPWKMDRGAPCLGADNEYVYGELLGLSASEIVTLAEEGVL